MCISVAGGTPEGAGRELLVFFPRLSVQLGPQRGSEKC